TRHGKLNVLTASPRELAAIRGREIAYIFQEPSTSLNPVFRVGNQIVEALQLHRPELADPMAEAVKLLKSVGIPDPQNRVKSYPHELSGGMQQRVMIAMALACKPKILVADEPTTALDVTIQQQILQLLRTLRQEQKLAIILVTHNLGVVAELADRVLVMYAGQLVENLSANDLLAARHPYTQALLKAVPRLGTPGRLHNIPGTVPSPAQYPAGCRFYSRCTLARQLSAEEQQKCFNCKAPLHTVKPGHELRCHYFEQLLRGEE
ncbi:MAG: ABC transporter ATP-binding protein, partial [Victivallaceae bacterium]